MSEVKAPARPTRPICKETRLRVFDAIRATIAAQPEPSNGAETAGAVVAILDVAAVVAFTGVGAAVDNAAIDAWVQETITSLGMVLAVAKAEQSEARS